MSTGARVRGELTERQRTIYRFIYNRIRDGLPPTLREIGERFKVGSPNGVAAHLRAIERKGWIVRDPVLARGIRLTCDERRPLEIVGRVNAGRPAVADAGPLGELDLREVFGDPGTLGAYRVEDDSLSGQSVAAGDIVIMRGSRTVGVVRVIR